MGEERRRRITTGNEGELLGRPHTLKENMSCQHEPAIQRPHLVGCGKSLLYLSYNMEYFTGVW